MFPVHYGVILYLFMLCWKSMPVVSRPIWIFNTTWTHKILRHNVENTSQ